MDKLGWITILAAVVLSIKFFPIAVPLAIAWVTFRVIDAAVNLFAKSRRTRVGLNAAG
jgi:hypothetical protein